jgi:hypothetical protein
VDAPVANRADTTTGALADERHRGAILVLDGPSLDAVPDAPWVQVGASAVRGKPAGRIAPDAIQAIVRANMARMRSCYEQRLLPCPNLQARVAIEIVIDLEGRVTSAVDARSDLPDRQVVQCVADEFKKLRFPKPQGGILTVVYPIIFSPGD